ncbi:MAG: hypothetical protein V4477_13185 [Pseudomonadota bacterium]
MTNHFRAIAAATFLSLAAMVPMGAASAADMAAMPVKAKPIPDLPFFLLIDNRFTYAYQWGAVDPGVTNKTTKQVFAFTHFDVWTYGTNFFNIGLEKAGKSSPANPCADPRFPAITGCEGATEIYGLIRSTIGFNEVFNTKAFTMGPLRNVSFVIGADGSTENRFFAASKRDVVAGLQFAFDLPYKGFFNVNPLLYYEFANHSTFTQCGFGVGGVAGVTCNADGSREFKPTWAVEMNYYMDLGFLPESINYFSVSGRAGFYGKKGGENGQIAGTDTKIELNAEPIRLTFDASKAIWGAKYTHNVDVWVAYRMWRNKFGLDENASFACTVAAPGSCREDSLYSGITVKF